MTYQEIAAAVGRIAAAAQCEYTYYQWPPGEAPDPPYLLFYYPGRDDVFADDRNYCQVTQLNLELYTDAKDPELEQRVEDALELEEFGYQKTESHIDAEQMYEVLYETEVILNGK